MGEQTASDGRRTDERQEAETAQRDAEVARREAEQADARRLAGDAFGAAEQAEDEAGAALERDPAAARQGFLDASRRYRQAAQEAADRRVAVQREDVKRARERMMDARRAAEQSAAGQRAPVLLDWARKKEREASAAVERQELVLAEQLFGAAQAEYEIAAREGRRTRDRGPSEQLSAEQAQRRAATYRELAVKAGADRLPGDRDLFAIAQAKEAGADELMSRQSFPLAAEAYGDAGDRYLAAARRAGDHTEADVARDGMRAEKGRAGQRTAEYRDALAEETQGASAYGRRAYREAAERFRTAQGLYARAATKATAGSGPARPR